MGSVTLTNFGGIVPRTSERLIPENAAQRASNCKLSSGELVPINAPKKVGESKKTGDLLSIFRIAEGGSEAWLAWTADVDVVKSPLFGTPYRWCYTGDGEPRITTVALATTGGGDNYPTDCYVLGVPQPITAPTVAPSGGAGAAVTRFYAYTFYSAWNEEGAVSPVSAETAGKVDDTWAITGMDATPPNSGTVTGSYGSGATEFTDSVNHWLRVGEEVVIDSTTMAVTAVTSTKKFKVSGDYSAEIAWARKAPWNTLTKRLYRTTGTLGTFELVAENISGTTYSDTLTDAQIPGDELISSTWEMPPVGLKGLILLPSQAVAGFYLNKIYVSEPGQAHAFPPEYQITVNYPVVGMESFESGIGVATESHPYIVLGVEPGQMQATAWKESFPCVSKRSVISIGGAVLYASQYGMISLSAAGASVWSLPYFTDQEWPNYSPTTMVSALAKRRLYLRYTFDGSSRLLVFNLLGDQNYLTEAFVDANEIYADPTDGKLYIAYGSQVLEFDAADSYPLSQDWQSRDIVLPAPENLGAAKVVFDSAIDPAVAAAIQVEITAIVAANAAMLATGNAHGAYGAKPYGTMRYGGSDLVVPPPLPPANTATFELYAGGKLRCSKTVEVSNRPFKLPSGYKTDTVSVRVLSQCKVKAVKIAQTAQELGT